MTIKYPFTYKMYASDGDVVCALACTALIAAADCGWTVTAILVGGKTISDEGLQNAAQWEAICAFLLTKHAIDIAKQWRGHELTMQFGGGA